MESGHRSWADARGIFLALLVFRKQEISFASFTLKSYHIISLWPHHATKIFLSFHKSTDSNITGKSCSAWLDWFSGEGMRKGDGTPRVCGKSHFSLEKLLSHKLRIPSSLLISPKHVNINYADRFYLRCV